MRDRLIELLNKKYDHFCDQCGVNKDSRYTDNLADYLLANGVVCPPCKVGDEVYCVVHSFEPYVEKKIIQCIVFGKSADKVVFDDNSCFTLWGKNWEFYNDTVFSTRAKAEEYIHNKMKYKRAQRYLEKKEGVQG